MTVRDSRYYINQFKEEKIDIFIKYHYHYQMSAFYIHAYTETTAKCTVSLDLLFLCCICLRKMFSDLDYAKKTSLY